MIEAVPIKRSLFNSYMFEAPGDDDEGGNVSVSVAPRANRGTDYGDDTVKATVRPTAARGATDYGADYDASDDAPADDTADAGDDTATDYSADDDTVTDDTRDEGGDDDADTATDYGADDGDDAGDTGDESGDDADPDAEGDGGDDTDSPTDYGADDAGGDDSSGDSGDDSGDSNNSGNGTNKGEALRKFHMYARFQHLYNVIETFIEKLRDVVKDDPAQNAVIKRVTTNFDNLHDNLYDFMMVKFSRASYVELLVYMEQAVAICKLNFELLKNNRIELKQVTNDWK